MRWVEQSIHPFVNPDYPVAAEIRADIFEVGKLLRAANNRSTLRSLPAIGAEVIYQVPKNSILSIEAATGDFYRLVLPDGQKGFIHKNDANKITPLQKLVVKSGQAIFTKPDSITPAKLRLEKDVTVIKLAEFANFNFVETDGRIQGWILK